MYTRDKHLFPFGRYAEMLVALIVIGLGAVVIWETQDVDSGPKQVGLIIGIGQILVGIWYMTELFVHRRADQSGHQPHKFVTCASTDWHRLGIIAVGLVAYTVLLDRAGFVFASTVLIVIAAFGLGSQRLVRDGACAILVSTLVFVVFDRALGVRLPDGWLSGIM